MNEPGSGNVLVSFLQRVRRLGRKPPETIRDTRAKAEPVARAIEGDQPSEAKGPPLILVAAGAVGVGAAVAIALPFDPQSGPLGEVGAAVYLVLVGLTVVLLVRPGKS